MKHAIATILIISIWFHYPYMDLWNYLSTVKIPDSYSLLFSVFFSVGLVFAIEWVRGSDISLNIEDTNPFDNGKRKFLKISIEPKPRFNAVLSKYLPSYVHSNSTITVHFNHCKKPSFRAKWETSPEPVEYPHNEEERITFTGNYCNKEIEKKDIKIEGLINKQVSGFPRVELMPLSSQSENFLPNDKGASAIFMKHKGEKCFYIYDSEYYFDYIRVEKNRINCESLPVKVIFKSSLGTWERYYEIANKSDRLEDFKLKPISKKKYYTV